MPNSIRPTFAHDRRRLPVRRLLTVVCVSSALLADAASAQEFQRPLRERASAVARLVLSGISARVVSPVRLEVANDSADAILGGFTETLVESGLAVRLSELPSHTGTVWTVRRTSIAESGGEALDVRVEQWPERSVLHSRLWLPGAEGSPDAEQGFIERLIVPMTVGAAAALIVYLFYSVRS